MHMSLKGLVVGTLAVAGATVAVADAQAMPVQPLSQAVSGSSLEHVYFYRYGYRRPFLRPFYGYRRFGYGYGYGYRRPFFAYRRPFYGYGYRRF